jgi:hypothetical protein
MSLAIVIRCKGHDAAPLSGQQLCSCVYLKDILMRLPTHRASEIDELLPHKWNPIKATIFQAPNC